MQIYAFIFAALLLSAALVSAGTLQAPAAKGHGGKKPSHNGTSPLLNCGGNCPGNDCSDCLCGSSRSDQNIAQWCAKYSGWNQAQCQCIMSHESGGNANALNFNPSPPTYDVGLWQINTINWPSCSGGQPPCNPSANLACAIKIWGYHKSFQLWSTCHDCNAC